jgi:hypothetical protein
MTALEAKELSLEVWQYLAEHPEIDSKKKLPIKLYTKIKHLKGECPLCGLYQNDDLICPKCPLKHCYSNEGSSLFEQWAFSFGDSDNELKIRKQAAQNIVNVIRAWEP